MPYPKNLNCNIRKFNDNIVLASGPFSILGYLNVGYRMALIERDGQIIVWSAMPYGTEVEKSLQLLTGRDNNWNVTHLVVPNIHHTLAVPSFKKQFPDLKIFATKHIKFEGFKVDYVFDNEHAGKVIGSTELERFGADNFIQDNFEFVFAAEHKNKELVLFDKNSKSIFIGDTVFNLGVPGSTNGEVLEQYNSSNGFSNFNPHGGWSFLTRYLQPESWVGQYLVRRFVDPKKGFEGFQAIDTWDYENVIMCHGNVIEKDGKKAMHALFPNLKPNL